MKTAKYITAAIVAMSLLTACEDYLSKHPSKGGIEKIEEVEQLDLLLNEVEMAVEEVNFTAAYSTDDFFLPTDLYDIMFPKASVKTVNYYSLSTGEINNGTNDGLWSRLYSNIYTANLILENIDEVSGDDALRAQVKAEAHFLRAYSNAMLLDFYCLPYAEKNMNELGVLNKIGTDAEKGVRRLTLRESYAFVNDDLAEALKMEQTEVKYPFRVSKAAIHAFLSRYYLQQGAYDKALESADEALDNAGPNVYLKDFNTLQLIPSRFPGIQYSELSMYNPYQYIHWPEFFYSRISSGESLQPLLMSNELLNLYDKQYDMRYKKFVARADKPLFADYPEAMQYVTFSSGHSIASGPSLPEVMLNKAECLLRIPAPDMNAAMDVINELREYRMDPADPQIALEAETVEEALGIVLQERRRELPFVRRWQDIRRFSLNETTSDDVSVTRDFYVITNGQVDVSKTATFTLPLGSRRYATPISAQEIALSNGQLEQNKY